MAEAVEPHLGRVEDFELLPGEPSSSEEPKDVAHWIAVYTELIEVLAGQAETGELQARVVRLQQREGFWRRRLDEPGEAGDGEDNPGVGPESPEPVTA